MLSEEMPCSSQQLNSQRGHNAACSLENYVLVTYEFLEQISAHGKQGSQVSGRELPVPRVRGAGGGDRHAARWFERSSRRG